MRAAPAPYDWGGYCKHIVAVLKLGDKPADVIERRPIAELLRGLDQSGLIDLIEKRLESDPGLVKWIEAELATSLAVQPSQAGGSARRRRLVDLWPVREQARALLWGHFRKRRYWDNHESSGDAEELQRPVEKAVPFLEVGDGRNALRVLEPIAEELVDDWLNHSFGSDETMYELLADLGRLMAEAALMSDITADERGALAETIEDWQDRLGEYGVDEGFGVAVQALKSGWDEPACRRYSGDKARDGRYPGHRRARATSMTTN